MIKVYVASKLDKAPLWKEIRQNWPEIEITSHWVDMHTPNDQEHLIPIEEMMVAWTANVIDIHNADVVLVHGSNDSPLRGALVEAGIGIALNKKVIIIGKYKDYGTWQFHPNCVRVPTLEAAREYMKQMNGPLE